MFVDSVFEQTLSIKSIAAGRSYDVDLADELSRQRVPLVVVSDRDLEKKAHGGVERGRNLHRDLDLVKASRVAHVEPA